ncbi:MAG TPA: hypothetical protein VMG98_05790 [Verrucomicrobiae bacterium]|nr:hypothetical protein [Verrucomicrobiae bacterium]
MRSPLLLAVAATIALAACGGGGASTPPASGGTGSMQSSQVQSQTAIDTTNALGDPVKATADFNDTTSGTSTAERSMNTTRMLANGVCTNGVEFWSPDKNGDPNSTEEQYFYDSACTELARDVERIYTINGAAETVNRTESQYAIGNTTAIATRTSTVNYVNGSYGSNGYPVVADGFARDATSATNISGSKTIVTGDELVMQAGSSGVNAWCGDSAGYNATGIAALNETFGWDGGVSSGGSRTLNGDGSVTWTATHTGTVFTGAIGSLSIATGSENTTCPIATPQYALAGGTPQGNYSIPVTATYLHGELTSLTVTNATLADGNTLSVTTNSNVSPTNSNFVTGTITSSGSPIATFAVDCFGDGTLTMTASGKQYVIDDWHVVK